MENSLAGGEERPSPRRISVPDARQMLGMIGKNYDDEDVAEILDVLYGIAEECYEAYLVGPDRPDSGSRQDPI